MPASLLAILAVTVLLNVLLVSRVSESLKNFLNVILNAQKGPCRHRAAESASSVQVHARGVKSSLINVPVVRKESICIKNRHALNNALQSIEVIRILRHAILLGKKYFLFLLAYLH